MVYCLEYVSDCKSYIVVNGDFMPMAAHTVSSEFPLLFWNHHVENATKSEEPAISIKTGKSISDCTTSTYLVPYKFRQQFDEIITKAIVNEKNITDVLNLTD